MENLLNKQKYDTVAVRNENIFISMIFHEVKSQSYCNSCNAYGEVLHTSIVHMHVKIMNSPVQGSLANPLWFFCFAYIVIIICVH